MLQPHRLLAASVLRRGALALDDLIGNAALGAVVPLDLVRKAVDVARPAIVRAVAEGSTTVLGAVLLLAACVAGCGCLADDAGMCTRDGERRVCRCGCHTLLGRRDR